MYTIKVDPKFGRGLYATKKLEIGQIISQCEILPLSHSDTIKVNETDLKYYTFVFSLELKLDCLVLGDGEIFNHSDAPNVSYCLKMIDGRYKMEFTVINAVNEGDQLFIDYGADTKVDTEKYINSKSLI